VPGVIAVGNTSLGDHLAALYALSGKFFFIALGTVDVMLLRNEAFSPNGILAGAADKALLVPLPRLVLHLLHSCFEYVTTAIASGGKLSIIAGAAINSVSFASKLLVDKAGPALVAEKARLMPVLLLV